ncbi:MAG: aminoacyl-tRNA hydrolase [Candidatus Gastranaerophilales bacterium]|nr:aminoacyl-tRNA hydrolase [Candidatus Gastranaerophilales bacterium]
MGNYPKEYDLTRHNIGFMTIDQIANKLGSMCIDNFADKYGAEFKTENKFKADIATANINNEKVILVKPLTFMNLSGEAIQKINAFYKIEPQNILIVYDDLSIELGKFRFRANGTDGGHNGIKSIINMLGTKDFPRLKVGIGPQPQFVKSESFVLQKFPNDQIDLLNKVVLKSVEAIDDYLQKGIVEVQNKYNGLNLNEL